MSIQPISFFSTNTNLRFNGLWGESTKLYGKNSPDELHHYFPFSDESASSIREALKNNTYADPQLCFSYEAPVDYVQNRAVVDNVLPFSEAEWTKYSTNKLGTDKKTHSVIEQALKRFNLKHLIK